MRTSVLLSPFGDSSALLQQVDTFYPKLDSYQERHDPSEDQQQRAVLQETTSFLPCVYRLGNGCESLRPVEKQRYCFSTGRCDLNELAEA
ncbi:hypothetical protein [Corynebacterium epidermidicanis]|uniref:hypothetical protein n=1 Tax=Corynebacterium epidermidicanis TaxID=1050174 RepID=UPI00118759D6|nr:hypothetical protein [Corynebacterium epidermidicanis]